VVVIPRLEAISPWAGRCLVISSAFVHANYDFAIERSRLHCQFLVGMGHLFWWYCQLSLILEVILPVREGVFNADLSLMQATLRGIIIGFGTPKT
jgi:hypothetical protein